MKRRPDGRWQKVKTIDGTKVTFYSSAQTEKQALKEIEQKMLEYSKEQHCSKHNFKMIAEKMLQFQSLSISYNTIECYTHSLKHLECFNAFNIEDITPEMVQKVLDDMSKKHNYSFSAVSKTKVVFGLILNYAIVHHNLPLINFTRSLKIPKSTKKGKVTAPPDFVSGLIIKNADKVEFGMWPMMFLCTGLRRGEQAALQRKHIDFENGIIDVKNAVEFIVNQPHVKGTLKNDASVDTVPIIEILKPYLENMCKDLSPNDYLFGKNKPLTKTQIDKRLKKYCEEIGCKFTGHQLRHAYAKMIYNAGIDPKTAQRLLRHANITTTMNIYTDFSDEMTDKSVGLLNNFTQKLVVS